MQSLIILENKKNIFEFDDTFILIYCIDIISE